MKETIEYYYNLEIDELEENDGKYHFKIDNIDFFFVYYNRGIEELDDVIGVKLELKRKGIDVHNIVINKDNKYLTNVNNYNYILFWVNNLSETYDIFSIVELSNKLELKPERSKLYRNNWGDLWSRKVDYFENQVRELALTKNIIKNSFSYYIGLAEIAISYVNNTNIKYGKIMNGKLTLSHRRIYYPNYKLNYLNPLSFIFDLEIRDIAEYLKSMFFKEDYEEVLAELRSYLQLKPLNVYEYQMFWARLIYPTYYFDLYEAIMNKDESEEKLIEVIKKAEDMETFLKDTYLEISKYVRIDKIDFLIY